MAAFDYDGRTVDLAAFTGFIPSGEAATPPSMVAGGGLLLTGAVKVAQWFIIDFQTDVGSVPYDESRGTAFMGQLRRGELRGEVDVFVAFGFAVGALAEYAAAVEPASAPDDERFADASLDSVVLSPGLCELRITLTTAAGTSRRIIMPIGTLTLAGG